MYPRSNAPRSACRHYAARLAVLCLAVLAGAGSARAQTASLTPASHDFGSVIVGQTSSPATTFTFTNSSSSTEIVQSVYISPPGSDFSTQSSGNCTTVTAAGSCSFTITFTPTATGSRNATLYVNSNDATSPQLTATLTGTGIAATTTATLTPASANFGSVTVGNSSTAQQFTLTNTGNTTIGNISAGTSGDFSAVYGCTTLAPSATCTIDVTFLPSAAGSRNGTLTVNSSSSSSPLTAALSGTGLSNLSGLTLSTYALDLGSFEVGAGAYGQGASPAFPVFVTNNDTTAVTFAQPLTSQGIAFPVVGDFLSNNNCGKTLAAGATCGMNLYFKPTTTGTRIGSLTIVSTASNGTQTLTLSGNGTDYTAAGNPDTVTVTQGGTAVFPIVLTPISGYSHPISLSCQALPATGTGCSSLQATLGPATTVNFSVATTPKNLYGVIGGTAVPGNSRSLRTWLLCLCSLLALVLVGRTRRLARTAGLLALLLALLWPAGGCSGKQPTPDPNATPPGTYTFTVVTIDTLQLTKTVSLTLVVKAQ